MACLFRSLSFRSRDKGFWQKERPGWRPRLWERVWRVRGAARRLGLLEQTGWGEKVRQVVLGGHGKAVGLAQVRGIMEGCEGDRCALPHMCMV